MTRILFVSSSRADVGILAPVWNGLAASGKVDTHVLLTGMHITDDAFARSHLSDQITAHKHGQDILGKDAQTAAASMGVIVQECARLYQEITPDLVFLVGDRLDMFPAAVAAVPFNLPLAHLHGGEVTLGAIDERLRHAMTKLSHLHFASTAQSAQRINSMGEEPWRIHVTGAPGLDTLRGVDVMERSDLMAELGFGQQAGEGLRLIGVHPESNSANPQKPLDAVLAALDGLCDAPTVFTAPNSDPGGQAMRAAIEAYVSTHKWARFHDTLGSTVFANTLRHADVFIGNSSSGILEAPLFALPFVNVGTRQQGRLRGENVIECASDAQSVIEAVKRVISKPRPDASQGHTPYGDGHAAQRIIGILQALPERDRLLHKEFSVEVGSFCEPW